MEKTYDLPSKSLFSRIIEGLDGIDYIITMEGWYWNSLDWMHDNTDWKDVDFIEVGWEVALQMEKDGTMKYPDNFPAEFSFAFQSSIWAKMINLIGESNGAANNAY